MMTRGAAAAIGGIELPDLQTGDPDILFVYAGAPDEIIENQHVREVYLGQEFRL